MKVCIYGAGAVGGHIAGRLAKAGADVSLVARGAHLSAIQAHGLRVETHDDVLQSRPRATDNPAELGSQDVVLVTLKAPSLPLAQGCPPQRRLRAPAGCQGDGARRRPADVRWRHDGQ